MDSAVSSSSSLSCMTLIHCLAMFGQTAAVLPALLRPASGDEPPHVEVVPPLRAHVVHEGHRPRSADLAASGDAVQQGLVGRVGHARVPADIVVAVGPLQELPQLAR
eukprot:CAMPEP_0179132314 /NCGR_PEP_ID=MMETSP0796-20121207/62882_1 /TAXON_ID=73915 /ORGANISM="Pyrodinium bahamense, Strain pbaha01" /LENGTH=106 /DNA_ID=CAMNT_0020831253 /DNA_START=196 /DNA_END=514 /DNA_ORIENTATION=-